MSGHLPIERFLLRSGTWSLLEPVRDSSMPLENASNYISIDTTSTTLTFLFWELSRNLPWQEKLRDELLQFGDDSPTFQQIQDLPVLDAVVAEALRLDPAAPASLPRETPAGGREINGYYIMEKVHANLN